MKETDIETIEKRVKKTWDNEIFIIELNKRIIKKIDMKHISKNIITIVDIILNHLSNK